MSYQTINLPLNVPHKQELLDPWRMLVSPIWCGHHPCPPLTATEQLTQPPGAGGSHPAGVAPAGWGPVGITVDDDSLPHILTFTRMPSV
jgi:hypothetical protein